MSTRKSLNNVTLLSLLAFAAIALALGYWSIVAAPGMLERKDNPRLVEAEEAIQRGMILDRNGQILAQSLPARTMPSGWQFQQRNYPNWETATAVGYYSLTYGTGGVEAAFDSQLRGDDLRDANSIAVDNILHRPEVGSDIRLTLDLNLQKQLQNAMGDHRGAVIVLDVPSGAVLAMISAPTFDPNSLDVNYISLFADQNAPLLNRVTQGIYQPGGALETIVLAAMLTNKSPLDGLIIDAVRPVRFNTMTLNCGQGGTADSLIKAYALACSNPFGLATVDKPADVQAMIVAFGLTTAPTLINLQTVAGGLASPLDDQTDVGRRTAQGVGQGDLTVTPLQMALVAATIANHGNALTPYLADAIRRPGTTDWQPLQRSDKYPAVITSDVADMLRVGMRAAVTNGAASQASSADQKLNIYGHASIAYTGQTADSWFIGFADLSDKRSIAVAVVVEGSSDPGTAATIGGIALTGASNLNK